MANKPRDLVTRFVSDVAGFLRGTDQVSGALDQVARDQDTLADKGETAARDLSRAYERAGDTIARDAKTTKAKTSQAYGDAGKEAGSEFAQNVGESVSSGDIGGLVSGTVGGLVGTFGKGGPIGIALAGLGAVGVGVFQSMQEGARVAAEAANKAFDQLREGVSREAKLNAVLEDRFGGLVQGWEQVQRYAEASGIPVEDIAVALADGGKAATDLANTFEKQLQTAYDTTGELDRSNSILIDGIDDLRDRATAMERAANAAKIERDALKQSEGSLRRSASYYADRGSSYAPGGSTYRSQVPTHGSGAR